jgi:hypothetical protein
MRTGPRRFFVFVSAMPWRWIAVGELGQLVVFDGLVVIEIGVVAIDPAIGAQIVVARCLDHGFDPGPLFAQLAARPGQLRQRNVVEQLRVVEPFILGEQILGDRAAALAKPDRSCGSLRRFTWYL